MLREIVLDTETTGLDAVNGDRLIELGCVELVNRVPTGHEFHRFLNPETRDVHPDAMRIHGISTEFLRDKPFFRDVWPEFLAFIGNAPLVIHNAPFDLGFLNMEFERVGQSAIDPARVTDTLQLARRKHPAGPNSLDALCKRYGIDNSKRTKHGAIMDSLLLAEVYVELLGERQATLSLMSSNNVGQGSRTVSATGRTRVRQRTVTLAPRLHPSDEAKHAVFVATLGPEARWRKYR